MDGGRGVGAEIGSDEGRRINKGASISNSRFEISNLTPGIKFILIHPPPLKFTLQPRLSSSNFVLKLSYA
jgi:hypothetical protein